MFRFEEKDEEGNVKGQYGYYDKKGKLKIVNYEADHNGFRAVPTWTAWSPHFKPIFLSLSHITYTGVFNLIKYLEEA